MTFADQKIVGNLFQPFIKVSGGNLQWTSLARSAAYDFLEFSDMGKRVIALWDSLLTLK